MEISKNNHIFNVSGDYSESWFSNNKLDSWEQDTFYILEHYKNKENGVYIDIGAWIGPTVLYAANIFNKVIALEPDTVALERLEQNLKVNNFTNISVVKKGLSDNNGKSKFGGNGPLGNSESTLLVSNVDYSSWEGRHSKEDRESNIIEIETITIETLLYEKKILPEEISLIKMDIEGGELILIPYLKKFLLEHKPKFYISLHACFLKPVHIELILDILFDIYEKCYIFYGPDSKRLITKNDIIKHNFASIVFE